MNLYYLYTWVPTTSYYYYYYLLPTYLPTITNYTKNYAIVRKQEQ